MPLVHYKLASRQHRNQQVAITLAKMAHVHAPILGEAFVSEVDRVTNVEHFSGNVQAFSEIGYRMLAALREGVAAKGAGFDDPKVRKLLHMVAL